MLMPHVEQSRIPENWNTVLQPYRLPGWEKMSDASRYPFIFIVHSLATQQLISLMAHSLRRVPFGSSITNTLMCVLQCIVKPSQTHAPNQRLSQSWDDQGARSISPSP